MLASTRKHNGSRHAARATNGRPYTCNRSNSSCRGEHCSPAGHNGSRKVSGRIWNPPLRRRGRCLHRPENITAAATQHGRPMVAPTHAKANKFLQGRALLAPCFYSTLAPFAVSLKDTRQRYNQIQIKSLSGLCALYNKKCPGGLNSSPGHLICVVPWRT